MAGSIHGGKEATNIKLFGTTINLQATTQQPKVKDEESKATFLADINQHHHVEDQQALDSSKRPDKIIPCPRCNSMDTKFCYFNNYNVNQPRHFCRGCQRYWTAGGVLRNVPIGAGRRKNKLPTPNSVVERRSSSPISGATSCLSYQYSNNTKAQRLGYNNITVFDAHPGRFPTSFSG